MKNGVSKKLLVSILSAVFILFFTIIPYKNSNLEAIFFNVGNADAILVKTPNNKYILIDTARLPFLGNYSAAKSIIYEYLKDTGIKELDYLIITHFDADHAGGAMTLMDLIKINNVILSTHKDDVELSILIPQYAKEKGINIIHPTKEKSIMKYKNGEMKIYQSQNSKLNENDLSIITTFTYNDKTMLFAGDAEIKVLDGLNLPSKIDVFKIGHHGAENTIANDFIKKKDVSVTILSTGPSAYNHPVPDTIKTIQKTGVYMFRTDVDNAIKTLITNKNKIKIYSFDKKKWKLIKL